ncbi:MAG: TVP38/TMEM64 family protein [Desulfobacterales bacterium]|jgi:uncharacterized membrane protein YdjX (TVP38/TMEM64 family)
MTRRLFLKIFILAAFILCLCVLKFYWDIPSLFNPENIQRWLAQAGNMAPLFYMLVMATAVVISPIPSLPLDVAAGAAFGPFLGTLYSVIGALGGAVISFMITRVMGRELLEPFLGGHINFCKHCSDKLLTKIVFLSRLLPVVSFDIVSYGAGLTRMSLKNFCLATFLGMLPLTFVYNYFGSVLVLRKGTGFILGVIVVILFFAIPRLIERYDFFSMRRMFQHDATHRQSAEDDTNPPKT